MAKRDKTATESLLQIAVGMEIFVVFFGALVVNGLRLYESWVVATGAMTALVVLIVLYRTIRYPVAQWCGHFVQVLFLLTFLWDVAIGLSFAVVVAFWIYGAIKGPQLDRKKPPSSP